MAEGKKLKYMSLVVEDKVVIIENTCPECGHLKMYHDENGCRLSTFSAIEFKDCACKIAYKSGDELLERTE